MSDAFNAYLERIQFNDLVDADLQTLFALHRGHLTHISYENLDIHFGRPLSLDLEDIHRKIVVDGRGGWCFEMNTLFRWALEQAGFDVMLIEGTAVLPGDHMLLCVQIGGDRYLADMGWGNGFWEPLPLVPGRHRQGSRQFELRQDGEHWRFANLDFGDDGFDFTLEPRHTQDFADRSAWLQTDPSSGFVRVVKAFRFSPKGNLHQLRGAVHTTLNGGTKAIREIDTAAAYAELWSEVFHCPLPNVAELWPKVHADHLEWKRKNGSQ